MGFQEIHRRAPRQERQAPLLPREDGPRRTTRSAVANGIASTVYNNSICHDPRCLSECRHWADLCLRTRAGQRPELRCGYVTTTPAELFRPRTDFNLPASTPTDGGGEGTLCYASEELRSPSTMPEASANSSSLLSTKLYIPAPR